MQAATKNAAAKSCGKLFGIGFKVHMTEKVSTACILLASVRKYGPTTCVSASGLVVPGHQSKVRRTQFLADRTNGRDIATLLRLSSVVCLSSVCNVMYCG